MKGDGSQRARRTPGALISGPSGRKRVLLVEANDMPRWVGGLVPHEVHVLPIGLMYVASSAQACSEVSEVRLVESSLDCPTDEAFVRILDEFRPDVVGIRSIVFFADELRRLARLTREYSGAAIVAGGPIVEAWKRRLFDEVPELEVAVKGDGELVFSQLLAGRAFAGTPGILYRDGQGLVENPPAAPNADLESLPLPAYDLVDLPGYRDQLSYAYNHRIQGVLVTSRGCVYHCTFCFRPSDGLRLRTASSVFGEIRYLHDHYGVRDFYIVDDIFNVHLKRAFEVFDRLREARLQVRLYFVNGLRADTVSEEFVDRAIASGAIWFTYAVESAAPEIQRLTRKGLDLAKAARIIGYTQKKDVVVNVTTMYGFPGETPAQAQMTLDYLGELPKASLLPYHFCLRFFPGCEIREQALAAGFTQEQLEVSTESCYHDIPGGTPTLSRADMARLTLQYHQRFGLRNPERIREAVATLRGVGYSDQEITHLYSVLCRKAIGTVAELTA